MKWKQAALVVLGGLALIPGGPAAAGPGSFGQTSVRGITIEAPPRTLYSDPGSANDGPHMRHIWGRE